ncbi:hypothetical protein Nepgr_022600 [Nepenthes gracilis]|uniref:Fe-S metabolism associated domain-containing protein n=1 Tax=Nepenthes gracilis TaxID=150966 RepID=A0AAD3XX59_NEPGR|nr:hypothetical protein Nepgr_022600 [Nepenthes gracilis]
MSSTAVTSLPPPSSSPPSKSKLVNPKNSIPRFFNFYQRDKKNTVLTLKVSNCLDINHSASSSSSFLTHFNIHHPEDASISASGVVSSRLRRLVSEFQSLPEPIDRVKRLLSYAMALPLIDESTQTPEKRLAGCSAQVWLEVWIDEFGRMRFKANSDSEIIKGFCSCLIYLLDGALPEEVLQVKAEDLTDVNVGLPVRSRVNSWHYVLISMQDRAKALIAEKEEFQPREHFLH